MALSYSKIQKVLQYTIPLFTEDIKISPPLPSLNPLNALINPLAHNGPMLHNPSQPIRPNIVPYIKKLRVI